MKQEKFDFDLNIKSISSSSFITPHRPLKIVHCTTRKIETKHFPRISLVRINTKTNK